MDRDLNEFYESLYNTNLKDIENNLDRFIEAKHESLKEKNKIDYDEN